MWLQRQRRDPFVLRAHREQWASRAAFKLLHIDDEKHILRPGFAVLDLGAAPGGWLQVAAKRVLVPVRSRRSRSLVAPFALDSIAIIDLLCRLRLQQAADGGASRGIVLGVDLQRIPAAPSGVRTHVADFTSADAIAWVSQELAGRHCDVVLCDAAPPACGVRGVDHLRLVELARDAWRVAERVLARVRTAHCRVCERWSPPTRVVSRAPRPQNGSFLAKVSRGGEELALRRDLAPHFGAVEFVKPPASRQESTETYLFARGYRRPAREQAPGEGS